MKNNNENLLELDKSHQNYLSFAGKKSKYGFLALFLSFFQCRIILHVLDFSGIDFYQYKSIENLKFNSTYLSQSTLKKLFITFLVKLYSLLIYLLLTFIYLIFFTFSFKNPKLCKNCQPNNQLISRQALSLLSLVVTGQGFFRACRLFIYMRNYKEGKQYEKLKTIYFESNKNKHLKISKL